MAQATFIQDGKFVDHTPVGALSSGDVVVQGDLIGVVVRPLAAGEIGALVVDGVFDIAIRDAFLDKTSGGFGKLRRQTR